MTAEAFPFELDVCAHCEQVYRRPDPRQIATMAVRPVLKVRWEAAIGAKKSFGTRRAAYQRYAWKKLGLKYACPGDCQDGPRDYDGAPTGAPCYRGVCHPRRVQPEYGIVHNPARDTVQYLQQRFVRWLMWRDAKLRGGRRVKAVKTRRAA